MKIAFYPGFTDPAALADRYWRAAHYLGAAAGAIARVDVHTDLALPSAPPNYLDQSLPQREHMLRERLRVRALNAELDECDLVIVWDQRAAGDAALQGAKRVSVLDPAMLHEGDLWIELGARIRVHPLEARERARQAVSLRIAQARAPIVNVFGTGPSLAQLSQEAIPAGAAVVCNSLVKNHTLMRKVAPSFIAAVDPIFHAGASRHAEAFRRDLAAAMRAHPQAIFVPQERDAHIYAATLPEDLHARIAPVPVRFSTRAHLELSAAFRVTATRNVLTLILLPLAANLGDEVRIYGCDGRPVSETSHFWGYDPASVFSEELALQQRAHPGFFTLSHSEYYALHCETTRVWVRAMEARGQRVTAATPSYIPALAARRGAGVGRVSPAAPISFQVFGCLAYARRQTQSAYGAMLASDAPDGLKRGLRQAAAWFKRVVP